MAEVERKFAGSMTRIYRTAFDSIYLIDIHTWPVAQRASRISSLEEEVARLEREKKGLFLRELKQLPHMFGVSIFGKFAISGQRLNALVLVTHPAKDI